MTVQNIRKFASAKRDSFDGFCQKLFLQILHRLFAFFFLLFPLILLLLPSLFLSQLSFFIFLYLLLQLFLLPNFFLFFLLNINFPLFQLVLAEKVLACFHFDIFLARGWLRRKRVVLFFFTWWSGSNFLPFHLYLLELRQILIPVYILHLLIFHQLALHHQLLYMVHRMNVLHCIHDYSSQYFDVFERAYYRNGASLNQNVALG